MHPFLFSRISGDCQPAESPARKILWRRMRKTAAAPAIPGCQLTELRQDFPAAVAAAEPHRSPPPSAPLCRTDRGQLSETHPRDVPLSAIYICSTSAIRHLPALQAPSVKQDLTPAVTTASPDNISGFSLSAVRCNRQFSNPCSDSRHGSSHLPHAKNPAVANVRQS